MTTVLIFAAVNHSIIDGVVRASVETDVWVVASAVASAVVAVLTGWLAWSTRSLSIETKELAAQTLTATGFEALREQQAARPVVVAGVQVDTNATSYLMSLCKIKARLRLTSASRGATPSATRSTTSSKSWVRTRHLSGRNSK
jgi:hypothetical protein